MTNGSETINVLMLHQVPDLYGSGIVLINILRYLDREKFHAFVVIPQSGPMEEVLKASMIPYKIIPYPLLGRAYLSPFDLLRFIWKSIFSIFKISQLIQTKKIHVVQSNTLAVLLGAIVSSLFRKKHLWHLHEIVERPRLFGIIFSRIIYLFSDIVIANSKATADFWVNTYPPLKKKIIIIPNSVDTRRFHPQVDSDFKERIGVSEKDIMVGLIGRINRLKGHKILLQAAKGVLSKTPNVSFVFVGDTPPRQDRFKKELEQFLLQFPQLAPKVKILPFIENIETVYKACDIIAVPSTEPESFGLVALEGMAMAKPVIASDIGGLREIVLDGVTGRLVKPGDSGILAEAILDLILNPESARAMGNRAREHVENNFLVETFIARFQQAYCALVENTLTR